MDVNVSALVPWHELRIYESMCLTTGGLFSVRTADLGLWKVLLCFCTYNDENSFEIYRMLSTLSFDLVFSLAVKAGAVKQLCDPCISLDKYKDVVICWLLYAVIYQMLFIQSGLQYWGSASLE